MPGKSATLIDTDLSTSVQPDRLISVTDPDYVLHLEIQASHDSDLPERTLHYHMMARRKFAQPVKSVVVLLRRAADSMGMTGRISDDSFEFRYGVVRMWEIPAQQILNGPIALLPLAPIAGITSTSELTDIIGAMRQRIEHEAPLGIQDLLWATSATLMGLLYPPDFTHEMLKGVWKMEESSFYQSVLAKGMAEGTARGLAEGTARGLAEGRAEGLAEGEREMLLLFGGHKLGTPDADTRAAIESINSVPRLQELALRLLEVSSWQDLLR